MPNERNQLTRLAASPDTITYPAAAWVASNWTLKAGQWGFESDTGQVKLGDGVTPWNDLPYTAADGPQGPAGADGADGPEGPPGIQGIQGDGMDEATLGRITPDQWNDLRVPLAAVKKGPVNPPDSEKWRDDGAGSTGVFGYAFSPTQLQQVFFEAQLPHTYKEGSRLAPHCHFIPMTVPTVGQTVRFGLEYTWSNVWGTFPTTTTIYAERTFVEGFNDQQYQQMIGGFDPDIEEPTMKVSAMISCRFFRDAAHANDTYTGDVVVLEFDFHHLVESFGSVGEFSK